MPRSPSPAQSETSKQNGKRSRGRSSSGTTPKSALDSTHSDVRGQTIALAHESILRSERYNQWYDYYKQQSLIAIHHINECTISSLLADRTEQFRQAELEQQIRLEERRWNRRERRRVRYLGCKIKTRPAEAVEQLRAFGQGVGFLSDASEGLIDEVRTWGYLPPDVAVLAFQVSGSTQDPASIGRNALAYAIQINNLGCTPGVPAAVLDQWLAPAQRPAALRDRPRHELTGADPHQCRERLLAVLDAERQRLHDLAVRVRRDVDIRSLGEALNRVSILSDQSARRAARCHAEARVTFHQASSELIKVITRDREEGPPDDAVAEAPVVEEAASEVAIVPDEIPAEVEITRPADADRRLHPGADSGPLPARGQEDGLFLREPENGIGLLTQHQDKTSTSVDARVPDSGCAKRRNSGAQTAPQPAQMGAKAPAAAVTDQASGSEEEEVVRCPFSVARNQVEAAEGPGTDEVGGTAGADQPLRVWTDVVPLTACRRDGSLLPSEPEPAAVDLAQLV